MNNISLQDLINDLYKNGKNAKSINTIKQKYPYLLGVLKNENMKFNDNTKLVEKLIKALEKTNNYCPCIVKKEPDTICPCRKMREENECICGLYVRK